MPVADHPPDGLIHGPGHLLAVPLVPADHRGVLPPQGLQQGPLQGHPLAFQVGVREAGDDDCPALAVGKIHPLAELPATDGEEEAALAGLDGLGVVEEHLGQLVGLARLHKNLLHFLDLLIHIRLLPFLQESPHLHVGSKCQQHSIGDHAAHRGHHLAEFLLGLCAVPLLVGGDQLRPSHSRVHHTAPHLPPGVHHVGVGEPPLEPHLHPPQ
mmetsp:Transcript_66476/g.152241  ORF Transcript_66476/g.152241 Transcript_66476/m.152241 type:complete len:212 (-) Transcript_66476:217-852(-)